MEIQAGGTDVQDRRRRGTARGALRALRPEGDLDRIVWHDAGVTIGALVRVGTVATDERLKAAYPGLPAAAGGLATPQIRAIATVGGALLQRTRCWYYRDPAVSCFKKGGDTCPSRAGDHAYGVCFDLGPCVWPHPSTLGAAMLAYDAEIVSAPGGVRSAADLFGDGSDPTCDHHLPEGDVLTAVRLGPPLADEHAAYLRVAGRMLSEWPLVEVVVRLVVGNGRIDFARVALGGVATVPLRLLNLERALVGTPLDPSAIARAAADAVSTARPLDTTRYKLELIPTAIADACISALSASPGPQPFRADWALPWTIR